MQLGASRPDIKIGMEEIGKVYFHGNHLGSTSIISNQSGGEVVNFTYDDWGKL
jgi:hypothetical protein